MKILAVDDEPLVLRLLGATLDGLGYTNTNFAATGQQALHLLNTVQVPYSCILLDIQMPGMDGIELCQRIRQIPAYRHTPIIMLTALSEKVYIDESFASGATDYLNKPIDATELGARLRVAQMIHAERQKVSHLEATQRQELNGAEEIPPFELSDPIQIDDVPHVVNSLALENYLMQLDRLGLFRIGMIGFRIRHVESLHASRSPEEFYDILADVAGAIFENTRRENALISYLGDGAFVAVVPRVRMFDRAELESNIANTLYEIQLSNLMEGEYDIKVDVGAQVNGSVFGTDPKKMIDLAVRGAKTGAGRSEQRSLVSRLWATAS